jgi:hypothetical protein
MLKGIGLRKHLTKGATMASTNPKTSKKPEHVHPTKKHPKLDDAEQVIVSDLEKQLGVEFIDKEQFIKDVSAKMLENAKREQQTDPIEAGHQHDKLEKLRNLWAEETSEEGPRQKEIVKALKDEGLAVSVTFPDENSYYLQSGGRNDSGSLTQPTSAIIAAAHRLAKPE